jgi:hypothetical protein
MKRVILCSNEYLNDIEVRI